MLQCGAVCCWGCLEGLDVAVWSCLLLGLFRGTGCCRLTGVVMASLVNQIYSLEPGVV